MMLTKECAVTRDRSVGKKLYVGLDINVYALIPFIMFSGLFSSTIKLASLGEVHMVKGVMLIFRIKKTEMLFVAC